MSTCRQRFSASKHVPNGTTDFQHLVVVNSFASELQTYEISSAICIRNRSWCIRMDTFERLFCGLDVCARVAWIDPSMLDLTKCGASACRNRTLNSLRHTYATMEMLRGEVDIHTLSNQMGNSELMIERHYSKLTATMAADRLT